MKIVKDYLVIAVVSTVLLIGYALCATGCGNADSGSDVDTDTDTDTEIDADSDTDSETDNDSDTEVDTATDYDSDTEVDTATDDDSDTGSESDTESSTDSATDNGIAYDCTAKFEEYDSGWWYACYYHGDAAGECVENSSDCEGFISDSDPTGTCLESQNCCLPGCALNENGTAADGFCQYLDQYCAMEKNATPQSNCGKGMLCCPRIAPYS